MRIAVPKETAPGERRVALAPDAVGRLVKAGHQVAVEPGAGEAATLPDELYASSGAALVSGAELYAETDLVARVQRPSPAEVDQLRPGSTVVGFMQPAKRDGLLELLAGRGVAAMAMELVPRTTKAQSMDALSSQATIAGYKAVLLGAAELPRILPMLTTAAGTLAPARAFVLGAGVAGLQAIATARRLGAVVSAFDVRPAVKEQVESLGATFVEAEAVSREAEAAGGYARELGEEQQRRVLDVVGRTITGMDLVITTAQIPGRPAPRLITAEMVRAMRPGSVVVDVAAETGGNCELTRPGEVVQAGGVTILGPLNLPSTVPLHATQMYSRNVATFIDYVAKDGALQVNLDDPIIGPMCVVAGGQLRLP